MKWLKVASIVNVVSACVIFTQPVLANIEVYGYQYPELFDRRPPLSIGDDAVVGRLACPPVTRLNLSQKESEALLIKRVVVGSLKSRDGQEQVYWRFDLKDDVFWWDGSLVSASDFIDFFTRNINYVAKERGNWGVPNFKAYVKDDTDPSVVDKDGNLSSNPSHVFVVWSRAPEFGEYILNNVPLYRPLSGEPSEKEAKVSSKPPYECVGLYSFDKHRGVLRLSPTKGYSGNRPSLNISTQSIRDGQAGKNWIEFRKASYYGGNPWTRLSDESADCWQKVDWSAMSAIFWNRKKSPTDDIEFREVMTELAPRGALLRSGAAGLGDLVSGPVARNHPGYNNAVLVRPFSSEIGAAKLGVLGFQRKAASSPRLTKQGTPLKLRIATSPNSQGLIEKVLTDAFAAVGISLSFVPVNALGKHVSSAVAFAQFEQFHGILTGISMDWPRNNLLAFIPKQIFLDYENTDGKKTKNINKKHLLSYARSLTSSKPDFSTLASIHQQWFELEPATILLQHQMCLEASASMRKKQGIASISDPDWFRKLVL